MRILYVARDSLFSDPGGDTVQITKTAEALEKYFECEIEIFCGAKHIPSGNFDLVHCFNIADANELCSVGHRLGRPLILSPIYVDYSAYESHAGHGIRKLLARLGGGDFIEYAKNIVKFGLRRDDFIDWRYVLIGHRRAVKKMLRDSAHVLPNSRSEAQRLEGRYGPIPEWSRVVNAIDDSIFSFSSVIADERYADSVMCIGRVEGRKGQLDLIRALNNSPYRLFIVGNAAKGNPAYYQACRDEAAENVSFVPFCDQRTLAGMLKAARVHVLPSWFETTGLVSLEAAAMECAIVVSGMGDTKEYFDGLAEFCVPGDVHSIRSAVDRAWNRTDMQRNAKFVTEHFTWKIAAEQTYDSYKKVLGSRLFDLPSSAKNNR